MTAIPATISSAVASELALRLQALLQRVMEDAGPGFIGTGVIVTAAPDRLPLFAMRPDASLPDSLDAAATLAAISLADNDLHDGFHILSPELRLLALAQYFSPPILPKVHIDRSRPFGGRYLAALFGSGLDGVAVTGIATPSAGIAIFVGGHDVTRR